MIHYVIPPYISLKNIVSILSQVQPVKQCFFILHLSISCKIKKKAAEESAAFLMEATPRFELGNKGFADLCLTTWLCRHYFFSFPDESGKLS